MENSNLTFEEILEMYPEAEGFLIDIFNKYIEVTDALSKLDDKFPVKDWTWDLDINRTYLIEEFKKNPSIENTAWTLIPAAKEEENLRNKKERLDRQLKCVAGEHEWKSLTEHIKWCKYCGTICRDTYAKDDCDCIKVIQEYIYPEYPHFLSQFLNKEDSHYETPGQTEANADRQVPPVSDQV